MEGWTDGWMDSWMDGWMDGWDSYLVDIDHHVSTNVDGIMLIYTGFRCGQKQAVNQIHTDNLALLKCREMLILPSEGPGPQTQLLQTLCHGAQQHNAELEMTS